MANRSFTKGIIAGVTFITLQGCIGISLFPENGSQRVTSAWEFGMLTAQPDVYQGRTIKLAGRMVGVETSDQGTLIMAEWLPYPSDEYQGPVKTGGVSYERFVLFYPGSLDEEGVLYGNKFLVIGNSAEQLPMVKSLDRASRVPHLIARCLKVWKTGRTDLDPTPDLQYPGFPIKKVTYCSPI